MKNRNDNLLLYIAMADAYAAATEYLKFPRDDATKLAALEFNRYVKHPSHGLAPGTYTDDTQMSIGVAETLLQTPVPTKQDFAEHFIKVFRRDRRNGYSRNFQTFLNTVCGIPESQQTQYFLDNIQPISDKNGAAMRSVPIGILADPLEVTDCASRQAQLTHDTIGGRLSSMLIALASHFSLYESEDFDQLFDFCWMHFDKWYKKFLPELEPLRKPWNGEVTGPGVGMNTVHAVFHLLREEMSLMGILRQTIEWGGDTDSVAAIAWGIASSRYQVEKLPDFLIYGLESGPYGGPFLSGLSARLMHKYDY
jgi:ADP-ribosyl-[dinitrogen reductase] hydrolase